MSEPKLSEELATDREAGVRAALQELALTEARCPFGPRFFLGQLAAFVRNHCPDPAEHLPQLELWASGERISVCHIVAITPYWIAIAARSDIEDSKMRTELVPYESIGRVTIGRAPAGTRSVGFDVERRPVVIDTKGMSPEEALASVAQSPSIALNQS